MEEETNQPIFKDNNPLLIAEITDKVFGYLDSTDLDTFLNGYDVCQLWRATVSPYIVRFKTTQPPVVIKNNLTDDPVGAAYLTSIRKYPILKSTKFSFCNTELSSPAVKEFLQLIGSTMEELELWYFSEPERPGPRYGQMLISESLTSARLLTLLRTNAPNLRTLTIKKLPFSILDSHLVQQPVRPYIGSVGPINPLGGLNVPLVPFASLSLRRLVIAINCDGRHRPYSPIERFLPPIWKFVFDLIRASHQLEEVELFDDDNQPYDEESDFVAIGVIAALRNSNRIRAIKSLRFQGGDLKCVSYLTADASPEQSDPSKSRKPNSLRHLSLPMPAFSPHQFHYVSSLDASILDIFLQQQRESLEYLELPLIGIAPITPNRFTFPSMPNLVQLRLYTEDRRRSIQPVSMNFNYATNFPRLRVLGLGGLLKNYVTDEIFPYRLPQSGYKLGVRSPPPLPSTSVEVLQEIPFGVDVPLMERIGRLFPNLSIIRTQIPFDCEVMLVSIWKYCPKITELFLTFDAERGETNVDRPLRTLDSLFSGIPHPDCARLRGANLAPNELQIELDYLDSDLNGNSLTALKYLKRLVIDGPATTLGGRGRRAAHAGERQRDDKLTDAFGFSTLAATRTRNPHFEFFQASTGMVELSSTCLAHICTQTGLRHVNLEEGGPRGQFPPTPQSHVRLIRPGLRLEGLGPVLPADWYGL